VNFFTVRVYGSTAGSRSKLENEAPSLLG